MSNIDSSELPLVTIITVVKNGFPQIENTINSVFSQDYPSIEYIIKDGQSVDGTLEVIKKYKHKPIILISEKDFGISDAWNQAISRASGEYIALLNSDDVLPPNYIKTAIKKILETNVDLVYGDTCLFDDQGRRRIVKGSWSQSMLWKGIGFLHPSVLASKKAYLKIMNFRTDLKFAMDADWIMRLYSSGGKFAKHEGIAFMSNGGLSNKNWKAARIEYLKVLKNSNIPKLTYFFGIFWFRLLTVKKILKNTSL